MEAQPKESGLDHRRRYNAGSFETSKLIENFEFKIMNKLTPKQHALLEYLSDQIRTAGLPPTVSEMAAALKLKSKNAVAKLLRILETKGYIRKSGKARGIEVLNPEGEPLSRGMMSLPLIGRVTAGMPMLAEEQIEDWMNVPTSLIKERKNVFILKVQGMSMKDAGILDGDLVLVKQQKVGEPGDIVVALIEDEATVKRLVKQNGKVFLKAENPAYPNIYPVHEWSIQGKVIGVIRKLE
jgi:repressor LexA